MITVLYRWGGEDSEDAHFVPIIGAKDDGTITVSDPGRAQPFTMSFSDLHNFYDDPSGAWTDTYLMHRNSGF